MNYLHLVLLLLLPGLACAANETSVTRSVGKFSANSEVQLEQAILKRPVIESVLNNHVIQSRTARHTQDAYFEFFDIWVELSGDIDEDGFYHHIKVTFDADTDSELETVYVKLYSSYEGGPWHQFAVSDLFEIQSDSTDDTYEILTELIQGYPPGYYDVLIELHSLHHPSVVASKVIDAQEAGFALTLEDRDHDDYYYEDDDYYDVSYGVGVSGSFSITGLLMLLILIGIKLRYFSAPNKKVPELLTLRRENHEQPGTRG